MALKLGLWLLSLSSGLWCLTSPPALEAATTGAAARTSGERSSPDGVLAPVCHDAVWEPAEFCGRDAFLATGTADMNHDCFVDWLDMALFESFVGQMGPNNSGDLNGSMMVDGADATIFGSGYYESVSPCTRGGVGRDECRGAIALSFDANPNNIVSTKVLAAPGLVPVYLVCSGWTGARALEYSLRVTGNASVVGPPSGISACVHGGTKQYYGLLTNSSGWPASPVVVTSLLLSVADTTPVTIELRPYTALCVSGQRIRWTDAPYNRSIDFASIGNAVINGAVPPGSNTCSTPVIASIDDIGNDQGRSVRIGFASSSLDAAGAPTPVLQYEAFRRIDALPKPAVGVTTAPASSEERARTARDRGMTSDPSILIAGWDFVGAVPAHEEDEYTIFAPTLADSTVEDGIHYSVFFMRAATGSPGIFFDSSPDSGYSVDNLAPNVPMGFQVAGVTGSDVLLAWNEGSEPDLHWYSLYRGIDPGFVPGESNRIARLTQTTFGDIGAAVAPYTYKLTATDFAGNQSAFTAAHVQVSEADPDHAIPELFSFGSGTANPARDRAVVLYSLPRAASVTLRIYDVQGRVVRKAVEHAQMPAGAHQWEWDLRDDRGARVRSGIYLHRFDAGEFSGTTKVVVVP